MRRKQSVSTGLVACNTLTLVALVGAVIFIVVFSAINFESHDVRLATLNNNQQRIEAEATASTVNISTGVGIGGGPVYHNGTIFLQNTSVAPGTYTLANITVDQQGRIIAAANGMSGSVLSVESGTGLTGGPITVNGTISLENTTVTPGSYSYSSFTVDQQGRLTAASNGTSPVTSVGNGTGLIGGPITSTGTLALANTTVAPDSYTYTALTVDAQGRITSAANGVDYGSNITMLDMKISGLSMAIDMINHTAITQDLNMSVSTLINNVTQLIAIGATVSEVDSGTGLTGGPITMTGTLSLANTTVTPGSYSYSSITVDQQGRLTAASNGTSPVTSVDSGTGLTGGPITSTGTISLDNTTVVPGSYSYSSFTVDQQGRLTAASNGTSPVTSVDSGTGLTGGPITSTGTLALTNTTVTPGTYSNPEITVDQQGRITAASNGTAGGGSGTVTSVGSGTGLTGGPITTSGTLSLANTAVAPGTYGDAGNIPVLTIDPQGRITTALTTPRAFFSVQVNGDHLISNANTAMRYVKWDTSLAYRHSRGGGTVGSDGRISGLPPGIYLVSVHLTVSADVRFTMAVDSNFGDQRPPVFRATNNVASASFRIEVVSGIGYGIVIDVGFGQITVIGRNGNANGHRGSEITFMQM